MRYGSSNVTRNHTIFAPLKEIRMIGFSKISCIALLLGLSFSSKAQEVAVAEATDIIEIAPIDIADVTKPIVVEEPHPDAIDPVPILLEKAQRENANRANIRTADLSDTECLATAMYHEARGEGERGLIAVAFVIYNRVTSGRFPDNFCGVVRQPSQFSFVTDRNSDNIRNWTIYTKVLALAIDLVENGGFQRLKSPVGNALFFNSFRKITTYNRLITTIGNHHFFK
jgi:hypothetical protein